MRYSHRAGRPIARLTPADSSGWPDHLQRMAAAGRIKLGSGKLPKNFWRPPRPKDPRGLVLGGFLLERESGPGVLRLPSGDEPARSGSKP